MALSFSKFGLGPYLTVKGNVNASAYQDALYNDLLPPLFGTVWGKPFSIPA